MQGRRRDGVETISLADGEYKRTASGQVWFRTPNGYLGHVVPHVWAIREEPDGSITVSPSIRMSLPEHADRPMKILFHGYLIRGVWTMCADSPAEHAAD